MSKELTGYPSIDRPWLKYYSKEAISAQIPEMSIYEWIKRNNLKDIDDVAISYLGYRISYKKLFEKIDCAAQAFYLKGVKAGDIVTLALPNIPENTIAIYALNKIGAVANLIDLRCQGDDLARYYNEVGSKMAVVSDIFLQNTLEIIERTKLDTLIVASPYEHLPFPLKMAMKIKYRYQKKTSQASIITWRDFVNQSAQSSPIEGRMKANDTACIMHTSGTTGESKGVMLSNHCFNAMTVEYRYGYGNFKRKESFFNQVPPFLAYNVIIATHIPLSFHLQIIMMPEYNPEKFAENMIKYKINHVCAGPADWMNFLDNSVVENKDLSFLKTLGCGSDMMRVDDKRKVNLLFDTHGGKGHVMEGYGMTEVGSAACTNLPQCDVEGSVGIPLPQMTFCVYDNLNDMELKYYEKGEICMTGPTLMNGYYGKKEETKAVLRMHADGLMWMHSGDLGYMDENGCVFLEGRLKRIIIQYNGMKINPYEVEKTILKYERVTECCVVGAADRTHGSGAVPVAFIVVSVDMKSQQDKLVKELQQLCETELVERYRPAKYCFIDKLPLTPNGKVDYRELERQADIK